MDFSLTLLCFCPIPQKWARQLEKHLLPASPTGEAESLTDFDYEEWPDAVAQLEGEVARRAAALGSEVEAYEKAYQARRRRVPASAQLRRDEKDL